MPTSAPLTALKMLIPVPFTVIVGFWAQAAAADNLSEQRYERVNDPSLSAGAESCKTRREDIFKNSETTPHFVTALQIKRAAKRGRAAKPAMARARNMFQSGGDEAKILTFKGVSAAVSSARWKKGER